MKKLLACIGVILLLVAACHNNDQPDSKDAVQQGKKDLPDSTDTVQQDKKYFPVADYIKSEIRYVDSLPVGIMKYNITSKHTDSGYIKIAEFNHLASAFLPAELDSSVFEKGFSETSFADGTTKLVTFTYTTRNAQLPLQRVDVIAMQGPTFDKVESIFMEITSRKNDTLTNQKMYWTAKKSFLVITTTHPPNQPPASNQLKVVWDSSD